MFHQGNFPPSCPSSHQPTVRVKKFLLALEGQGAGELGLCFQERMQWKDDMSDTSENFVSASMGPDKSVPQIYEPVSRASHKYQPPRWGSIPPASLLCPSPW